MRMERLGERALILRELPCAAYQLASRLNLEPFGPFLEAVASYETIGLYFSEAIENLPSVDAWIRGCFADVDHIDTTREFDLPVCYELGEDLESSANRLGIPSEYLIGLHLGSTYQCFAVGFSPGFAYLGYLSEAIRLPRRDSPRTRVEPGSVGIAGGQTAVYPCATPGGWNLIGRCPLTLVDVEDGYFPIGAGDTVRFFRIDDSEFERRKGERL